MISVIIPTYNSANTALIAIKSVIYQTYQNWNIIIIDDGSEDNTFVVINDFLKTLPHNISDKIKLVQQSNQGPSSARNLGLTFSEGEYIAFLDSDDEWSKDKLEVQMKYMENDKSLYLCSTAFGKKRIKHNLECQYISFNKLLFSNYFSTPSVLLRAKVLDNYNFDISQKFAEDYRLWLLIAYNHKCLYVNRVLVNNQSNKRDYGESGLSSNLWEMEKGELSNFIFLYKNSMINIVTFLACSFFSIFKFNIRLIKSKLLF
ncbi:glycosyltransferase family 2 protein [Flavobacterium sp. LS1R49]|uniref:Glycosyltransferase family 2 protein n=1 Tax=Flavobacterium shii TaxID=2987687 RepID=A0A9X3C6X8_9FLAO|nr:glycosyltransferase family A protein [Flavobacterium shii]MCV9927433.1 glycosyltransferase family 2 protein [Flavobacterium shii]